MKSILTGFSITYFVVLLIFTSPGISLQKIIIRMEPKYQEVLALRYFEQKPVAEICQILNKKEGTVKSLISRGLDKIRTRIKLLEKTAT
ncbi:MAG: sigma-70 family RNA polymerase sigma factor [Bacteroidetes bacterium]|nr:sigma-70 family RNA polymerase sigma factor [Bacteroidota bacterium]MCH8233695.1 sigma-70 family RNA polymerase sigma factor [Bacteroidota bacterium]